MAEWSNAQHWKCCVLVRVPRVRIPPSPPFLCSRKPRQKRFYSTETSAFQIRNTPERAVHMRLIHISAGSGRVFFAPQGRFCPPLPQIPPPSRAIPLPARGALPRLPGLKNYAHGARQIHYSKCASLKHPNGLKEREHLPLSIKKNLPKPFMKAFCAPLN